MKKLFVVASAFVVILLALCLNPVVSCNFDMPHTTYEAIESQSKGLYSSKLPLAAVYVNITDYSENKVYYTIYYFPFGTVDMSYSETDGYNIEKPLSSLS